MILSAPVAMNNSFDALAALLREQRHERARRRALDPADFEHLREVGFGLTGLPESEGGSWAGLARSTRPICEMLRRLAQGDPSLALVASMHPGVLLTWTEFADAPAPHREAWRMQRAEVFATVRAGAWWGTVKSEPGSGGNVTLTRSVARRDGDRWRLTGDKHFGSGAGITTYMKTVAVPEGESEPELFFVRLGAGPWDGSAGVRLVREWDGYGMKATQSHSFRFDDVAATRIAWPRHHESFARATTVFDLCAFSAVAVGVVQAAFAEGRPRTERSFERIEWAQARVELWLIDQAYEGMLRTVESGDHARATGVQGKVAIAQLAERALDRLCRVHGGPAYSRALPYRAWADDVRALGLLRPPWGAAFEQLGSS